ncbi:MAG TPA: hypothetical protein VIL18_06185 [Longimicrobiales bacterium]
MATEGRQIAAGVGAMPRVAAKDGAGHRAPAEGRRSVALLAVVWIATAGTLLYAGLDYYLLPLPERAYAPGHRVFAPTGVVGWTLGVAGTLFMLVGVSAYAARKRWARLSGLGRLRSWLRFHIFLCTLGPFLIVLHSSFKVRGLISIAFWSMVLVVASGVFGRYVYARIPKTIHGQFRSLQSLRERHAELVERLQEAGITLPETLSVTAGDVRAARGLLASLFLAVRYDLRRRSQRKRIRRYLETRGVDPGLREALARLADEQLQLEQQIVLLSPFQRLFRYWHTFHVPLATLMLVIALVHVAVAVLFGYMWPF